MSIDRKMDAEIVMVCVCVYMYTHIYVCMYTYTYVYTYIHIHIYIHIYMYTYTMEYSVQFSFSVMSGPLQPHGLQHPRPPCPSPTPWVYPNSCPLSRWCHPTILSSVVPFFSHLQSFPESGSFQMSQLFAWGGQSIGVSASASVLSVNTQDWSPCSPRDSQESSPTPQFKSINSSALSFLYTPTLTSIHDYWKNHSLD